MRPRPTWELGNNLHFLRPTEKESATKVPPEEPAVLREGLVGSFVPTAATESMLVPVVISTFRSAHLEVTLWLPS